MLFCLSVCVCVCLSEPIHAHSWGKYICVCILLVVGLTFVFMVIRMYMFLFNEHAGAHAYICLYVDANLCGCGLYLHVYAYLSFCTWKPKMLPSSMFITTGIFKEFTSVIDTYLLWGQVPLFTSSNIHTLEVSEFRRDPIMFKHCTILILMLGHDMTQHNLLHLVPMFYCY